MSDMENATRDAWQIHAERYNRLFLDAKPGEAIALPTGIELHWRDPAWPKEQIGLGVSRCPDGEGQEPHRSQPVYIFPT